MSDTSINPTANQPILNPIPPSLFVSPPLPATTTAAQDSTIAGQRRINLIWEVTQALIAIAVVGVNMIAALYNVFHDKSVDVPMIMSSSLFLILGFYFSRTNHTQIGGLGDKPTDTQPYQGR